MRETKRVIRAAGALDDVSDHMGEILRRADELLVEWSRFGAEVRAEVEREAQKVGHAVAGAVDGAVARAASASVDRAITDQIGAKLTALSAEIGRLEARARAASRSISDERRGDRRVLWVVAAGIVIANALLVLVLLRRPSEPALPPAPEATRVETPVAAPIDAAVEPPSEPEQESPGSATTPPAANGSAAKSPVPGLGSGAVRGSSALKPVKVGPPVGTASFGSGAKLLPVPPTRTPPRRK